MNKILKYILFRIVLVVISLHTIIPHPHADKLTQEKHHELHKESKSLIGFIRLVFHESNDESIDNLIFAQYESVQKIDSKHKHPQVSVFDNTTTTSIVGKRATEKIIEWNTNNFNRLFFVKLNGLRGPPQLT